MWFILKKRKGDKKCQSDRSLNSKHTALLNIKSYTSLLQNKFYTVLRMFRCFYWTKGLRSRFFTVSCTGNAAFHSMSDVGYSNFISPTLP